MNQRSVGLKALEAFFSRKPIKGLVNPIFWVLRVGPPHRQIFFNQWSVVGFAHLENDRRLPSHLNLFNSNL